MLSKSLLVSALATAAVADEHILGVYVFHRHGDRTPKVLPSVSMTSLGADEVFESGGFFRNRYIQSGDLQIAGISSTTAKLSQLMVTAPKDIVLHNSAMAFVQGLYPPSTADTAQTLANKTQISAPLSGYQYIPVNAVDDAASNSKSESNAFLQSGSGCSKALASSNSYLQSSEFNKTAASSQDFYNSLKPIINGTFKPTDIGFSSAYTIFDYINVATIHNETFPGQNLITNATYSELINLASIHEWNLAYNSSDPVRAISGSILAGQTVNALQAVIDDIAAKKTAAPRFNVQFGAYGTFMAFFGLANLPAVSPDFYGICDYASSMAFELVAPTVDAKESDISVRFLFANGTAAYHEFKNYPLFGQDKTTLPWADFKNGMSKFAVMNNQQWCNTCGNTSGSCAPNSTASTADQSSSSGSSSGVSRPVAGVIGALVTLVVILGAQALVMLVGGVRFAKKSTLARAQQNTGAASAGKA